MKNFLKSKLSIILILLLGAFFRFYGLNWDQGYHLHPDERFLTMVTQAVKWPQSLIEHLNPQISPLNPYNTGYNFFVYGTLPMYLVKATAEFIKLDSYDYNNITLVGRAVSAIFDLGTLILVFLITKKLVDSDTRYKIQDTRYFIPLLVAFLYAISVLPIQLSHFYAVDTFLVFFITLSFYLLTLLISQYPNILISIFLGISFGFALTCKITALLFLPIIGLGFLINLLRNKDLKLFAFSLLLFTFLSYLTLRIADPRIFATGNLFNLTLNPQFLKNLKDLQAFGTTDSWFPPSVYWISRQSIWFPLENIVIWGLGLPLGILTLLSISFSCLYLLTILPRKSFSIRKTIQSLSHPPLRLHLLIATWIIFFFIYQAVQFGKNLRYFLPIFPFSSILAAQFLYQCINSLKQRVNVKIVQIVLIVVIVLLSIWPLAFTSIYSRLHSRVTASRWIYEDVPYGSTISCEHWDDCLPLGLDGKTPTLYKIETLTLYDPDTPEKWETINQQLDNIDFLILSSNRLWGSIPRVPERYPIASQFYQDLFAERLKFKKLIEIASYPTIPIFKIPIIDDSADEVFTVYDHPKVIIFKKVPSPPQF